MAEPKQQPEGESPKKKNMDLRPALRSTNEMDNPIGVDGTNSLRPPEFNRPVIVPTPSRQDTNKPILLNEPTSNIPTGCFTFMSWMVLELEFVNINNSIRVSPKQGLSLVIGRNPEVAPVQIDIDLTPFVDGSEGVSRVHAAIKLEGTRLELEDKNSTNGTSINGIRFNPNESHPLRSGDVIMLAQLQVIVKFTPRLQSSNKHDTNILSPLK